MRLWPVLVLSLAALAGCGPTCETSCERLYGDGSGQCNINVAGREGDEGAQQNIRDCEAMCLEAMSGAGEMGDYDPNRRSSGENITISNEKQAAAWMDCVVETSCDNIADGYCQPHR